MIPSLWVSCSCEISGAHLSAQFIDSMESHDEQEYLEHADYSSASEDHPELAIEDVKKDIQKEEEHLKELNTRATNLEKGFQDSHEKVKQLLREAQELKLERQKQRFHSSAPGLAKTTAPKKLG